MALRDKTLAQQGFSLIEVFSAASISLIIALASTSLLLNQFKMSKTVETNSRINNEVNLVRMVMQSEGSCLQNLNANLPANTIVSAGMAPISIPKIDGGGSPVIKKEADFTNNNYYVSDINLGTFNKITPAGYPNGDLWTAKLQITYKKRNVFGEVSKSDVDMQIRTNPAGAIIGCSSTDLVFSDPQISDVCQKLGGTYSASGTPACQLTPGEPSPTTPAAGTFQCTQLTAGTCWDSLNTPVFPPCPANMAQVSATITQPMGQPHGGMCGTANTSCCGFL
jgi:Tfp pilus assembly protein PilV